MILIVYENINNLKEIQKEKGKKIISFTILRMFFVDEAYIYTYITCVRKGRMFQYFVFIWVLLGI